MSITFACEKCGKAHKVDRRFAGKRVACKGCGTVNRIPERDTIAMPGSARPGLLDDPDATPQGSGVEADIKFDVALADAAAAEGEIPVVRPAPRQPQRAVPVEGCPNCGSALPGGSFFCTDCGFNLKTGKVVATAVAAGDADDADDAVLLDEDRNPPNAGLREGAKWLIITGVLVALLPVLGLAVAPLAALGLFGPMLGAVLAMVGSVLYFIDGAPRHGMAGGGATLLALIVLFALGTRGEDDAGAAPPAPVAVAVVPPPATMPATTMSAAEAEAALPPIKRLDGDRFSFRKPRVDQDVVEFYRPALQDADAGVRAFAVELLAKVPAGRREDAVDAISEVAGDPDALVRLAAMTSMGLAKTPKAVEAAVRGLQDADDSVARTAADRLAQYKDESAIEPLAAAHGRVGEPVLAALAGYGPEARERVAQAYRQIVSAAGDPKVRAGVLAGLSGADAAAIAAAAPVLVEYVADADAEVRAAAIRRLGEMRYEPALPALIDRLRDDPEVAAKAVAQFGGAAEAMALARLADPAAEPAARGLALLALKEVATARSLEAVQAAARDPQYAVAAAARAVWRKLAPGALTPVDEAMMDLNGGEREFVAKAVELLKRTPVDPARRAAVSKRLFELMTEPGSAEPVPTLAREALEAWADSPTKSRIATAIGPDSPDGVRGHALKLALAFRDVRAIRPLVQCLGQGRDVERVFEGLAAFGPAAEDQLIRLLSVGRGNVMVDACALLRDIGTRRCFAILAPLANGKEVDEQTKRLAKETMIAINRRLNTEAARLRPAPPLPGRNLSVAPTTLPSGALPPPGGTMMPMPPTNPATPTTAPGGAGK
jgi:HEAT repeat protein